MDQNCDYILLTKNTVRCPGGGESITCKKSGFQGGRGLSEWDNKGRGLIEL